MIKLQPKCSLAVAETKPKHPIGESSHENIDGILHHDVGFVLQRSTSRLQQSKPGLDGEDHEDVAEDPGGVVVLPDAGVLVHGDGLRHVLLQDCVIVVGFWFLVEILINIFLWILVGISF